MRRISLFCCLASLVLSGCEGVRQTLGLDRDPPDAFATYKRAPLEVPPGFGALPDSAQNLPTPEVSLAYNDPSQDVVGIEDARPQEVSPIVQAQKSVFGQALPEKPKSAAKKFSPGENAFIQLVEKELPADIDRSENIRQELDKETRIKTKNKKTFLQRLLFWQKDRAKTKEALDPVKEYQERYGSHPGESTMAY